MKENKLIGSELSTVTLHLGHGEIFMLARAHVVGERLPVGGIYHRHSDVRLGTERRKKFTGRVLVAETQGGRAVGTHNFREGLKVSQQRIAEHDQVIAGESEAGEDQRRRYTYQGGNVK